jgi:TolA-binding protein
MRRWNRGTGFGFGYGSRPYHRRYGYYPYAYPYYAYPYAYAGAYPYYGYDDSGVYSSYSTNSDSDYYQQQQLNAELGSLNQQIDDLREQNDSLRDYVTRGNPQEGPVPQQQTDRRVPQSLQQPMQSAVAPAPATVLVFRDGHTAEVGNYAIVGKTLWSLSERRSQKYPLADIDLAKTQQENEKRGVEFTAPLE